MSLQLPAPAIHAPFLKEVRTVHQGDYYTAGQVQACRDVALEEAAQACEALAVTDDHDSNITRHECAGRIRSLKS